MNRVFFLSLLCSIFLMLATGCTGFATPKTPQSATHASIADAPPPAAAPQAAVNLPPDALEPPQAIASDGLDLPADFEINDSADRGYAASTLLSQAEAKLAFGDFRLAVRAAAQSYAYWNSEEALATAQFAASQMDADALEQAYQERQTNSLVETAFFGAQSALRCQIEGRVCPLLDHEAIAFALDALGLAQHAQDLRSYRQNAQSAQRRPPVAVFLPLSGADRRIGRAMLGAILQASGIYTQKGLNFDLRLFDTKSSPESIAELTREAAAMGIKLILGPIDAQECLAAASQLEANDMLMLGFSLNDLFVSERAFQLSYGISAEAQVLARFIIAENKRKIASVYPQTPYGQSFADQLEKAIGSKLGIAHSRHAYPETEVDLRKVAKKIAAEKVDLIFFPSSAELAERMASFLAQENVWCAQSGATASKTDARHFVSCIAPSAWSPIDAGHHYKFIQSAIYLDYIDANPALGPDFGRSFKQLYHREASIYEIMPYMATVLLNRLDIEEFEQTERLQASLYRLLRGQRFILEPRLRQITEADSVPYHPLVRDSQSRTERTLITRP